ncbi:MAG: hypothetical protein M1399_07420 [Actinobacteria bacterium]|nr:hypothetical protein [Actinomycetota bacterium]
MQDDVSRSTNTRLLATVPEPYGAMDTKCLSSMQDEESLSCRQFYDVICYRVKNDA